MGLRTYVLKKKEKENLSPIKKVKKKQILEKNLFPQNPSPALNLNSKMPDLKFKFIFPVSISTKLEIGFSNDIQHALKNQRAQFQIFRFVSVKQFNQLGLNDLQ